MNHMSVYLFQGICIPSEPQEPLYEPHAKLPLYGHSGPPVITGSHCISLSCTSSHFQAVPHYSPDNAQKPQISAVSVKGAS